MVTVYSCRTKTKCLTYEISLKKQSSLFKKKLLSSLVIYLVVSFFNKRNREKN